LGSTLFVAMLAHGIVILGITFAPSPPPTPSEIPTLNVTLLVDTNSVDAPPSDSDLLAERNQIGGGEADSERPTRTLTAEHPRNQQGEPLGTDAVDAEALEAGSPADQLVSRNPSDRQIQATPETTDQAAPEPLRAAALLQREAVDTLAAEIDDRVANSRNDDADVIAPNTREAVVARYMVNWRQRVERVGTANFPAEMLSGGRSTTRPEVEVTIDPQGQLHDIVLRKSSGNVQLDQAALRILELAAPFEPLPDAILAEHDMLRFSYEWEFSTGQR
jgi:protein TonB